MACYAHPDMPAVYRLDRGDRDPAELLLCEPCGDQLAGHPDADPVDVERLLTRLA